MSAAAHADRPAAVEDPYAAILEHAELELELAGRGEIDQLLALGERWDRLTRALPAHPPAGAGALLQRSALIHERTRIELIRLRDELLGESATASRARQTADGYAGQLPQLPRVDRNA
jgi:hypothetical protein